MVKCYKSIRKSRTGQENHGFSRPYQQIYYSIIQHFFQDLYFGDLAVQWTAETNDRERAEVYE